MSTPNEPSQNQNEPTAVARPPPRRIFIVPYRNRIQQKFFFCKHMSFLLEDHDDYEILFSHQCDSRVFNRGATKNIGFLAAKQKYPDHYKDITFIFNDIDTIPFHKLFDYETTHGVVKHYYGFEFALGGIVLMKGADFERVNGFPCYWSWSQEDNVLQKRCEGYGLTIDRSHFYKIGDPNILQLYDGISRIISKKTTWRAAHDDGMDGISTITGLRYTLDKISLNDSDNVYACENPRIEYINIRSFNTYYPFENDRYFMYDLREPKLKIVNPDNSKETKMTMISPSEWTSIPQYDTSAQKRKKLANEYIQRGQPVPDSLVQQIRYDESAEVMNDAFNNLRPSLPFSRMHPQQPAANKRQWGPAPQPPPPHKYSTQYANYIGAKPRATASARVRLGGIF